MPPLPLSYYPHTPCLTQTSPTMQCKVRENQHTEQGRTHRKKKRKEKVSKADLPFFFSHHHMHTFSLNHAMSCVHVHPHMHIPHATNALYVAKKQKRKKDEKTGTGTRQHIVPLTWHVHIDIQSVFSLPKKTTTTMITISIVLTLDPILPYPFPSLN